MGDNGQTVEIVTREDEGNCSSRGSGAEMVSEKVDVSVLRIGTAGNEGDISVRDGYGYESIHLDGSTGDIR